MKNAVIGIGDIVIAGHRKTREQDRQYFTGLIVGETETGKSWFIVDLASKKGYQHTIPKKLVKLCEAA